MAEQSLHNITRLTPAKTADSSSKAVVPVSAMPLKQVKQIIAALILGFSAILIFGAIDGLTMPMRVSVAVFVITLVCWVILDLPETPVALSGAIALAVTGTVSNEAVYAALGKDIIWLMLAAFILAAVLQASGLIEKLLLRNLTRLKSVRSLFYLLTLFVFMTAFIIPSTSARAAILLPVYVAIAGTAFSAGFTCALALLFPTIILLSAGASLTGAGAHLVAADFISRTGGREMDFLSWIAFAAPFSLLISLIACELILRLFLNAEERKQPLPQWTDKQDETALTRQQKMLLLITGATVVMFATTALHGIDMPLIALIAALLVTSEKLSPVSFKNALKLVEWNLLLFLAGTLVIGEALLTTGTAELIAQRMLNAFGAGLAGYPALIIGFAAITATLAHIVINSRTARAIVLIPALCLPLAGLGIAVTPLILVVTLASGFCQTLLVSAKPVTLFGTADPQPFSQRDLLRLALWLIVPFIGLLMIFALLIWPMQGMSLK